MRLFLLIAVLAVTASAQDPPLTGKWMGYSGGAVHTWQFQAGGKFIHIWVMPGSGRSLLKQERGDYRLSADAVEFSAITESTGMLAPHDTRAPLLGGAQSKGLETRRAKLKVVDPGKVITLDGVKLTLGSS
jgi:hypothetical protein